MKSFQFENISLGRVANDREISCAYKISNTYIFGDLRQSTLRPSVHCHLCGSTIWTVMLSLDWRSSASSTSARATVDKNLEWIFD